MFSTRRLIPPMALLVAALWLVRHHPMAADPLGMVAGLAIVLVVAVLSWARRCAWIVLLPATLPVIGFAPWSGWIGIEEWDILLLALAAGYFAQRGTSPDRVHRAEPHALLSLALMAAFGGATLISLWRGLQDASPQPWGWFDGYHEPLNSWRLAKPFLFALLTVPLWLRTQRIVGAAAWQALGLGMVLSLAGISLATIWERLAYTGLLNFSTDYRTTALFWEMHVGGAALDGFLALAVPFAVRELLQPATRWSGPLAGGTVLLAAYACLTTFSRGVYLAVPIGLGCTLWLMQRQGIWRTADSAGREPGRPGWRTDAASVLAFGAGAAWLFPASGYRGLLALWGCAVLFPWAASTLATIPRRRGTGLAWTLTVAVVATLLTLAAIGTAALLPKGAYIGYAGAALLVITAAIAAWRRPAGSSNAAPVNWPGVVIAAMLAQAAAVTLVAGHWGGGQAAWRAVPLSLALAAWVAILTRQAWYRQAGPGACASRWPRQAGRVLSLTLAAAVVAVFSGGAYMGSRFATGSSDFQGRLAHWRNGLDLLQEPWDWLLGKGQGRFPSASFYSGASQDQTGDYRWVRDAAGTAVLVQTAGKHTLGWGEMFRMSQRLSPPDGPVTVKAAVRVRQPTHLHLEVCEKHLLYNAACLIGSRTVQPLPPQGAEPGDASGWQTFELPLSGRQAITGGRWFAPRFVVFSMAIATPGARVEWRSVSLHDQAGRELLSNTEFTDGLARWFFSSDRHHMPWHMKSMPLHVLFEQGVLGLLCWSALVLGALWRLTVGTAARHPLAPALAGAIIAFGIVGLFDSLLDAPRIAFLFYFLVLTSLMLAPLPRSHTGIATTKPGRGQAGSAPPPAVKPSNEQASALDRPATMPNAENAAPLTH